eukprot:TRINITY_DN459_c2_g1_i1.p1 TRINITY_DN459_c2_g1~~TRINITY_DN459_c2_g1_i1.p1  ORF type:complete len:277 (+),score=40.39 TRINITY_DN459_c2_g1_i1:38-868(+)
MGTNIENAGDPRVSLSPGALCFSVEAREGKPVSSASLKLKSNDTRIMIFKLKTSAPFKYYVKPSSGVIHPDEELVINVRPRVEVEGDKFLMEVRPVTDQEKKAISCRKSDPDEANRIMDFTSDDKDLIAKLWKRVLKPTIKPLQFVLMTHSTPESIAAAPRFATPKDRQPTGVTNTAASSDPPPQTRIGNTMMQFNQENEETRRLKREIQTLRQQQETLEEARSTLQHTERLKKLPKLPPLTIPLQFFIPLILFAFVFGVYLSRLDMGDVPSTIEL